MALRRALALSLAIILLAGACNAGTTSTNSASSSASPAVASFISARDVPGGAVAPVDDATWALADRLTAPSYTADTTSAFKEALARAGIAVVPDASTDPATALPEVPLTGATSPFELLDFQAHALAVGAWTGASWSGAELDSFVPLPPSTTGVPTMSDLLAAYVASADSPGGALARALMAGQNLLEPATVRFPGVVLVLFASDLATDGGRIAAPGSSPTPSPSSAAAPAELLALAQAGPGSAPMARPVVSVSLICSGPDGWIDAVVSRVEAALTAAMPQGVVGVILTGVVHWLVHIAVNLVKGLIDSVVGPFLGIIRSMAAIVSGLAEQIASLLPYSVQVTAAHTDTAGGATFKLGPDPERGAFTVQVTAGDLPTWPGVLKQCADAAGIALPDFTSVAVPLTFGPIEPANPMLGPTDQAISNTTTDKTGQASWPFLTDRDPGDRTGEQHNQFDRMPVAVHRAELDELRAKLTADLLAPIPGLLRPYVAAIFAPVIDSIQSRLNDLLDARGTGTAIIVYHDKVPPSPSPSTSPGASAACAASLPPGTYQGSLKADSTTIVPPGEIDLGESGGSNDHGTGPVTITVAGDGSLSGTFSLHMLMRMVYQGLAVGTSDTTVDEQGAGVGGTICNPIFTFASETITGCTSTGHGTCGGVGQTIPLAGMVPPLPLGAPTSVSGGTLTWSISVENSADAGFGGLSAEVQSTTTLVLNGH
jgi:hypothetical protein